MPAVALDVDLLCTRCEYNLRDLELTGNCPECGDTIRGSYERMLARNASLPDPLSQADSSWLKQVREGVLWLLVAYLVIVLIGLVPGAMFAWKTKKRAAVLGIVCARWVLECFGVWKIATPEHRGEKQSFARQILRFGAVSLLVTVLPWWTRDQPLQSILMFFAVFGLLGIVATPCLYLVLARLARRAGCRGLRIAMLVLLPIMALWSLNVLLPELDAPEDSLHYLFTVPSIPYASVGQATDGFRQSMSGSIGWMEVLESGVPLCAFVTLLRMWFVLKRNRQSNKSPQ
jgi:hypothetical protein